jgi:glycosyltransferase involved in cell wall biosynthesis
VVSQTSELVSIVVVAYNSGLTIQETLQSCYSQSYPNVEVIVADDGSQDETLSVATRIAKLYPKVKTTIVANSVNGGIVVNCRSGLAQATGSWVKFLAADDILVPTGIADLVAKGDAADVVLSQFRSFGTESRLYPTRWTVRGIQSRNLARAMLMGFGAIAPAALIRISVLRAEGLPSTKHLMADDTLFYDLAKLGYRFTFVERVTVNFRVHDNQITAGKSAAAAVLRAEQTHGREMELKQVLGSWHPYVWHVEYQRLLDRLGHHLPRPVRSALRLLDPFLFVQLYVNRELPWQRARQ